MTILFKELAGSPVETYGPEGMKAQRQLLSAFEDRYAVVAALMGGGAAYPGQPSVIAMRVRVEPFEKRPDNRGAFDDLTADLNSYSGQFVAVTVQYETFGESDSRFPSPQNGIFMTYHMDLAGEYMAIPDRRLQWQSDSAVPVPPGTMPTLRIPITEHQVTWHRVNDPPWDTIRDCIGAVNSVALMGAAPETLLFDGAKADRQFKGLDDLQQPQFGWRITYTFREKSIKTLDENQQDVTYGWNHAYCTESSGGPLWDKLVDPNGNTLYRSLDLSPLFQLS